MKRVGPHKVSGIETASPKIASTARRTRAEVAQRVLESSHIANYPDVQINFEKRKIKQNNCCSTGSYSITRDNHASGREGGDKGRIGRDSVPLINGFIKIARDVSPFHARDSFRRRASD